MQILTVRIYSKDKMKFFDREIEIAKDGMTCESLDELIDKIAWCEDVGLMDRESNIRLQPYAIAVIRKNIPYNYSELPKGSITY